MKRLVVLFWLTCLASGGSVYAQRLYTIGSTTDLVGAVDTNPLVGRLDVFEERRSVTRSYGVYPSIALRSKGPHSMVQSEYAFALNEVDSDLGLGSHSHTFRLTLNSQVSKNLKVNFSDSFVRTPDIGTLNLFRGVLFTPSTLFFNTDALQFKLNSTSNSALLSFDYAFNPRSSISFGGGHWIRNYDASKEFVGKLSDQSTINGNLDYRRTINERTSWEIGYSGYEFLFSDFGNVHSHIINVGFSRQMSPTVLVRMGAGPSYTEGATTQRGRVGSNGFVDVSKSFEADKVSFTYELRDSASTGAGSVSGTQQLRFYYSHPVMRKLVANFAVSLYDARQLLDNPVKIRGVGTSLILNVLLGNHWTLNVGGNYQRQEGTDIFAVERKQLFVSLTLRVPEFLRFER